MPQTGIGSHRGTEGPGSKRIIPGVKKWLPWFIAPVVICFLIFLNRSTSVDLMADTDTIAIVNGIEDQPNPWAWFVGDWPLENHFYRPISTLSFVFDDKVNAGSASQLGTTNALIAIACVLLLFWFVRELTDRPWLTGLSTTLFGLWHLTVVPFIQLGNVLTWLSWLPLLGMLRGKQAILPSLLASLSLLFFAGVVVPPEDFMGRIVHWLPGRTASVMLIFVLIAMASYARYERLTAKRIQATPTSTDLPATKGTVVPNPGSAPWIWLVVCSLATLLALGSYEQAVMLPATLLGIAILFRTQGWRVHWPVHAIFWILLVGYLALRWQVIPSDASQYQKQQFRSGPSVYYSLLSFHLPLYVDIKTFLLSLQVGYLVLMSSGTWEPLMQSLANIAAGVTTWRDRNRWLILASLTLAFVAYMPMAWLKPFSHYWYWPCAMWSVFVLAYGESVFRSLLSAAGRPAQQAPPRLSPAPGSLLHQ